MSFNPTVVSGFLKFSKPVPLSRQWGFFCFVLFFLDNAHLVKAGQGGNFYLTCGSFFFTPVILIDKSLTPRSS